MVCFFFPLDSGTAASSPVVVPRGTTMGSHLSDSRWGACSPAAKRKILVLCTNTLVPLPKNSTSFDLSDFFIQAAGLAYHHDAVVDIISPLGAVSHHALACILLRLDDIQGLCLDDIQCSALMICNSYGIDDIQCSALMIYNAPH